VLVIFIAQYTFLDMP